MVKIETTADDRRPVDHHDLVVGDGDLGVDTNRDAGEAQIRGGAVLPPRRGLIEDGLNVDAAGSSLPRTRISCGDFVDDEASIVLARKAVWRKDI